MMKATDLRELNAGDKDNVDTLSRRCKALEGENAALLTQREAKNTSEAMTI